MHHAARLIDTAQADTAEVDWLQAAHSCEFDALDSLTSRELDILHRLALAASNTEIAEALWLSVRTVEAHLATIYLKLNLRNRGRGECRVAAALSYLRACRMLDEPAFDAIRRSTTAGRLIRSA